MLVKGTSGNDTLFSGADSDWFVFAAGDVVFDFAGGEHLIVENKTVAQIAVAEILI